jgi:hypothetical protein
VAFTPTAGPLTIRFDRRPASGTLTVMVTPDARVSVRVVADAPVAAGDLLVLPDGFRVRNTPAADYRVTVPAGTDRVVVRYGGRPADADTVLAPRDGTPVSLRFPRP